MNVLIADDDSAIRSILRLVIERTGGTVVGEAENGEQAIEASHRLHPDLLILDVSMPLMNGFVVAKTVNLNMPALPFIFVTQYRDAFYVEEAMNCGARGYVVKSAAVTELPQAMHAISRGETFCSSLSRVR